MGAGPGDPDLITVRGREILSQAEVVLHDALAHEALLAWCPAPTIINVGKRYGKPSAVQQEIIELILQFARDGKRVVRLKGGDPYLFARGAEETLALAKAGIPFEIVPGISSPVGTSSYAGFPLTHRTLSSSVLFITGSDRQGVEWNSESLARKATAADTLCILMGMRRIEAIVAALIAGGRPTHTPVAVVQWGARPQQRVATGTLATIAAHARDLGLTNPAIIVVGDVVTLRESLRWYDNRALFGCRVVIPRPAAQAAATARAVRARGAEPICVPAIEIHPPPDPALLDRTLHQLRDYQWVVFTSANGVERGLSRLSALGLDARAFGAARIAVIGPKTAAALALRGLNADLIAEQYVGESLADAILRSGPVSRVLVLRALEARTAIPERLRSAGAEVDVVAAYQTLPVAGAARERLRDACAPGNADVILFTSSSTVTSTARALGSDAETVLGRLAVASIGPITTQTAIEHGIRVDITADEYTVEGLLCALERRAEITKRDSDGIPCTIHDGRHGMASSR